MRIEQIEIRNYRSFRHAVFANLPPMIVVVGANGTGKSTLLDVFSFLKDALIQNVATAVARRGRFRELVSRGEKGSIGITIKFRESGGRLATYVLQVAEDHGRIVVEREILRYRRGQFGKPWHFVDFSRGVGSAITNESVYGEEGTEEKREAYKLDDPSVLAIKGLGQFREFQVVSEFRSLIENWHVSDFHIADARPSSEAGYAEHLSDRGDNVAQVAQYLYENHRECFDRVLKAMSQRVPGVSGIDAKPTEDGRLVLRFQDGSFKDPFIARYVSDGTIKMFAYLVLLYDPKPHPLLAVEEPENHLYPELLIELAEEFRDYARRGGQVFVSTHSPDFLNGAGINEIFWLVKKDGFTIVRRASRPTASCCAALSQRETCQVPSGSRDFSRMLGYNESHCVPARRRLNEDTTGRLAAEIISRIVIPVCAPRRKAGLGEEHPAQVEGLARAGRAFRRGTGSGQRGLPPSEDQSRPTVPEYHAYYLGKQGKDKPYRKQTGLLVSDGDFELPA